MSDLVNFTIAACGGCCEVCSITYQTRTLYQQKCGYNGASAQGVYPYPPEPSGAAAFLAAGNCAEPAGYAASSASLWYYNMQTCWIYFDADTIYDSELGIWGNFCGDAGPLEGYVPPRFSVWSPSDLASPCLTFGSGSWAPGLVAAPAAVPVQNQFGKAIDCTTDMAIGSNENTYGGEVLTGTIYSSPDCTGDGTPLLWGEEGIDGTSVNLECGPIQWGVSSGTQYLYNRYPDADLLATLTTLLSTMAWVDCSSDCMASLVYDASAVSYDHGGATMTELQYTITSSTGGTCKWNVKFTDPSGGVTNTPMTGSGTYTIVPDQAGTWEITDLLDD